MEIKSIIELDLTSRQTFHKFFKLKRTPMELLNGNKDLKFTFFFGMRSAMPLKIKKISFIFLPAFFVILQNNYFPSTRINDRLDLKIFRKQNNPVKK